MKASRRLSDHGASPKSRATGYRFYSRFLAARVMALDDRRATPAERLDDGRDFVLTNKWVLLATTLPQSPDRARW